MKKNMGECTMKRGFLLVGLIFVFLVGCVHDHSEHGHESDAEMQNRAVEEGLRVKGSLDAPVTLVAYEDFQCGYCGAFNREILPVLDEKYISTGKAKLVYKDFPVRDKHPMAQKASEAARCAGDQGKFWEYHDVIYAKQKELSIDALKEWAKDVGLDSSAFDGCLDSDEKASLVEADFAEGLSREVDATPTVFVNDVELRGLFELKYYEEAIEHELGE